MPKTDAEPDPAAYIPELMAEYAAQGDTDAVAELARLAADPDALAEALGESGKGRAGSRKNLLT